MKVKWKIGKLTIYPYRAIPRVLSTALAWVWFGWKAALIVIIFSIDENTD